MAQWIWAIAIGLGWFSAHAEKLPIAQGWTTASSTQFAVLADEKENLFVEAKELSLSRGINNEPLIRPASKALARSTHFPGPAVHTFVFHKLKKHVDYELLVRNVQGEVLDRRSFRTLDLSATQGRIAMASCMFDKLHNPWAWRQMEKARPDVIFFIGDAVYLDKPSLLETRIPDHRQIWQRHVETRQRLEIFKWDRLVPILAIHDDHDYGFNNGDGNFSLKAESARAFKAFFPREFVGDAYVEGPGLAFKVFDLFGTDFTFLDSRTFRDYQEPTFGQWGEAQEDWALSDLNSRPTFLVNGSQFFGGYLKKDSYEFNSHNDFLRFLDRLREQPKAFAFLSGDIHFSELMEVFDLGYPTVEITSSAIHSATIPGRHIIRDIFKGRNPRRVMATSTHNFAVLEVLAGDGENFYQNTFVGWRGQNLGEYEFRLPHVRDAVSHQSTF